MFIDFVIQICDRIMRQTAEKNSTDSLAMPEEAINKPQATKEVVRES